MKTNMKDLQIIPATRNDVQTIYHYTFMMAEYENLSHQVTATPELIEHAIFDQKAAEPFIVEYKGNKVGIVLLSLRFSNFVGKATLYIEDIILDEDVRGKGIGTEIFYWLGRLCVNRQYGRMEWQCLDWNEPSIHFYEKMGGEVQNGWLNFRLDEEGLRNLANGNKE